MPEEIILLGEDKPVDERISVFEKSLPILGKASGILLANQERVHKAKAIGQKMIDIIAETGMSDELDIKAMNYLVKAGVALKEIKEARAGVTQIADALKGMFTALEAEIDPKKSSNLIKIQEARNAWAKKKADDKAKETARIARETEKKNARINLKYSAINQQQNYYAAHLLEKKNVLLKTFNATTLETYQDVYKKFESYSPAYGNSHFSSFVASFMGYDGKNSLFTQEELVEINAEILTPDKYKEFNANYTAELSLLRQDLLDKLPSKHAELEEAKRVAMIAEENKKAEVKRQQEEEKKRQEELMKQKDEEARQLLIKKQEQEKKAGQDRLEKIESDRIAAEKKAEEEKMAREEEERQRIARESEELNAKATQAAEVTKQGEVTMTLFEGEAQAAQVEGAGQVRQGYDIVVVMPAGWGQIFQQWFLAVGMKITDNAKMEKTTMLQMKTWSEKLAHKEGTKIESPYLSYEISYAAVNKAAKAK